MFELREQHGLQLKKDRTLDGVPAAPQTGGIRGETGLNGRVEAAPTLTQTLLL